MTKDTIDSLLKEFAPKYAGASEGKWVNDFEANKNQMSVTITTDNDYYVVDIYLLDNQKEKKANINLFTDAKINALKASMFDILVKELDYTMDELMDRAGVVIIESVSVLTDAKRIQEACNE